MRRVKTNSSVILLQNCKLRRIPSPLHRQSRTSRRLTYSRLPLKKSPRLKRTGSTKQVVPSSARPKSTSESPSLAQSYFHCACFIKVTELLRLAVVPADTSLVQLATALLTLLAATDSSLQTHLENPWLEFTQFLQQPGHAVLTLRRLPFFIQAGQVLRTPRVTVGTQSLTVAKKLAKLVELAYQMTDETPQGVKKLLTCPRPLRLKLMSPVPEYAKGVGVFNLN